MQWKNIQFLSWTATYRVQVSDQLWCCHTAQLLKHSVSSQSESVPETEMLLPDTSLPQISQSEPSILITTNEQSDVLESVEKPTAESPTLLIKLKRYPQTESVWIDCHTSFS